MTKETIKLFSEMHAEPSWLADLRQKAFDKIETLELPVIERVKFHRWNLGDGTITESEPSANVPDFTALDNHLKLVLPLHSHPGHLDLHSCLEHLVDQHSYWGPFRLETHHK